MFNKKSKTETIPKQAQGIPAIISANTVITGNIHSEGELQVDGKVIGNLEVHTLIIGREGVIEGNTIANVVQIKGCVYGEIRTSEVNIERTAKVRGDVYHDTLSIEAGAQIAGKITHKEALSDTSDNDATPILQVVETDAAL